MALDRSKLTQEKIDKNNAQFADYGEDFVLTDRSRLVIETTNYCNSACSFCVHKDMKRKKGFMNDDLYKKIIDEATEIGFKNVELRHWGEPLLDKKLEEKASYAREKNFESIFVNTNGALLNKQRFESLIKSGITHVGFSISPKREFEKTRPFKFETILNNLKAISKSVYKKHLLLWFIETNETTKEEIIEFNKLMKKIGITNIVYTPQIELRSEETINPNVQCHEIWENLIIDWNGDITLCHMDCESRIDLGNAKESSLINLLNNEAYKTIRKSHKNFDFLELCKKCEVPIDGLVVDYNFKKIKY